MTTSRWFEAVIGAVIGVGVALCLLLIVGALLLWRSIGQENTGLALTPYGCCPHRAANAEFLSHANANG